jgi:hypothetical protein
MGFGVTWRWMKGKRATGEYQSLVVDGTDKIGIPPSMPRSRCVLDTVAYLPAFLQLCDA